MAFEDVYSTDDLSLSEFGQLNDQIKDALQGSDIAGGEAYIASLSDEDIRTRDDADVVVSSTDGFVSACSNSSVDSIFIDGAIDVAGHTVHWYDKDVFSDRGVNGSPGGMIYSSEKGYDTHAFNRGNGRGHLHPHGDSNIFGLRIRGDCLEWDASGHPGYVPYGSGSSSERRAHYNRYHSRGIKVHDSDVTISNCRIWGWGTQGIQMGSKGSKPISPHIHHVEITDCMLTSAGYAIDILRGRPLIEDSYMNATRHSLCTFGYHDSGWHVKNCLFGPSHSSHVLDAHGLHNNLSSGSLSSNPGSANWEYLASGRMVAENCTFLVDHVIPDANFDGGRPTWAVSIRGVPWPLEGEGIVVNRCEFVHDGPQYQNHGIRSFSNPAAMNQGPVPTQFQNEMGFSQNFIMGDNKYGISLFPEYDERYGIDVNLRDPSVVNRDEPRMARNDPHGESRGKALRGIENGLKRIK